MGYHESSVVDKILGTNSMNDMPDRPKKRHKDYKRIITMKTLDTSVYCEGLPYLVKFNGDPKGKGIDNCDGRVGICIEASGGNLTFVFVSGTYVHEKYIHKVVSISCEYLDSSKIEIIPYWSDTEVLKLIDSVKHDPDKFHGYSYWNEEIQIYDQDNVEKEKLNEYFRITIDGEVYPLLIPKFNKDEQYDFNMDALQILEDKDLICLFHIKRKHLDEWKTYGDFKIKVLHNPDGFQMFHMLKTDDENMELKDTWFPGDILSNIKGIQIETSTLVKEDTEDTNIEKVEEIETENRVSKKDEILLKEIQQLVDGFENKRFAIASLLATTIDIGCGVGEKEGEKKCANCPLTSYTCREISNRAKMLLSDTCDEQTANEGNE